MCGVLPVGMCAMPVEARRGWVLEQKLQMAVSHYMGTGPLNSHST